MVTKRDDDRQPTTDRVNIEQSASGRLKGRVLQFQRFDVHCTSMPLPLESYRQKDPGHVSVREAPK